MSIIEINGLTKLYKNGRGVKSISLTADKGDILGLLGPNGSGKTTIMKAMCGLINYEGGIKLFGKELHDNFAQAMSRTGALIEAPAIYKDLSAYRNLQLAAAMHPEVGRERIEQVLDAVHLLEYRNDRAGRFSLGMKQRLGIAAALLCSPELVVLDEPVNGLDIEGVVEVRETIKSLNERGVTFVISSHMAGEIEKTCTRVAVLYDGEKIADTSTAEALRLHPSMEDYFLDVVRSRRGEVRI